MDSIVSPNSNSSEPAIGQPTSPTLVEFAPGRPRQDTPTVILGVAGLDVVVLGRDPNGWIQVYRADTGETDTYTEFTAAVPISDPARRTALLHKALVDLDAGRRATAEEIRAARAEHAAALARIRAYAIERHRAGDIDRDELDHALREFNLDAYAPQARVRFTITGSYSVASDDTDAPARDARYHLALNLDSLDDVVGDSADYTVHVDGVDLIPND